MSPCLCGHPSGPSKRSQLLSPFARAPMPTPGSMRHWAPNRGAHRGLTVPTPSTAPQAEELHRAGSAAITKAMRTVPAAVDPMHRPARDGCGVWRSNSRAVRARLPATSPSIQSTVWPARQSRAPLRRGVVSCCRTPGRAAQESCRLGHAPPRALPAPAAAWPACLMPPAATRWPALLPGGRRTTQARHPALPLMPAARRPSRKRHACSQHAHSEGRPLCRALRQAAVWVAQWGSTAPWAPGNCPPLPPAAPLDRTCRCLQWDLFKPEAEPTQAATIQAAWVPAAQPRPPCRAPSLP
mmetsp:Transcript_2434/g.7293  ORF Transcript_2434/g.7293 Transcript_2434/m.7293 type:complete len:297 (-) Transcript_2434:3240-4130(-)